MYICRGTWALGLSVLSLSRLIDSFVYVQPSYPGMVIVSPQGEFLVYMDVGDKALEAWYQRLRADRVRAVKLAERVCAACPVKKNAADRSRSGVEVALCIANGSLGDEV